MANNVRKGLVGLLGVGALALGMSGEAKASMITFTPNFSGVDGNEIATIEHNDYFGFSTLGYDLGLDHKWSDAPPENNNTKIARAVLGLDYENSVVPRNNVDPFNISLYIIPTNLVNPQLNVSGFVNVSVDNSDGSYNGRPLFFQQTDALGALVGSPVDFNSIIINFDGSRTLPFDYSFNDTISSSYLVGGFHGQFSNPTANVPEPSTGAAMLGLMTMAGLGFSAKKYFSGRRKEEKDE